jgi:hypothetical protein
VPLDIIYAKLIINKDELYNTSSISLAKAPLIYDEQNRYKIFMCIDVFTRYFMVVK